MQVPSEPLGKPNVASVCLYEVLNNVYKQNVRKRFKHLLLSKKPQLVHL